MSTADEAKKVFDVMKKYVVLMLIVGAVFCAVWFGFSYWLISFSDNHDWLSSFVEIAFALNAAMTFDKIREYITPLREMFDKRLDALKGQHKGHRLQEKVLKYVDDNAGVVFAGLKIKAGHMLNWIVNFARVACLACIVALLVHGDGDNVAYIPTLVFPCIFYCVGDMVLMFVIADDIVGLFEDAVKKSGVQIA